MLKLRISCWPEIGLKNPSEAHLDDDVFVDVPNVLEQMRADTRYRIFSRFL